MFFFQVMILRVYKAENAEGDILAKVKTSLEDQPWHGNAVVSLGSKQFKPSEFLGERCRSGGSGNHESGAGTGGVNSSMASALSLANYSLLGPAAKAPVHMTTERRGITIQQIQKLLDFVSLMVQFWTGTHGDELGVPLTFEGFNLYHANDWVIKPATAGQHGQGCSYVEFLGSAMWIASHERNFSYIRQLSHDARNVFDCLWFCAIMILEEYNFYNAWFKDTPLIFYFDAPKLHHTSKSQSSFCGVVHRS